MTAVPDSERLEDIVICFALDSEDSILWPGAGGEHYTSAGVSQALADGAAEIEARHGLWCATSTLGLDGQSTEHEARTVEHD